MIAEFFYAGTYGVTADCGREDIHEMNQEAAAVCFFYCSAVSGQRFEGINCVDAAATICDVLSCQCFVSVPLFYSMFLIMSLQYYLYKYQFSYSHFIPKPGLLFPLVEQANYSNF